MSPRRRAALPTGIATTLGQKLMVVVALAAVYAGAVALALAAGLAPNDLERFSGAGWLHDQVSAFDLAAWSQTTSIGVGVGSVLLAAILLRFGWAQRLIPHRTRHALELATGGPGTTTVHPRTVERIAEVAAAAEPEVRAAKATLGEGELSVDLHVRDAARLQECLIDAKARVVRALSDSGVGDHADVRLTITRFSAPTRTELLR